MFIDCVHKIDGHEFSLTDAIVDPEPLLGAYKALMEENRSSENVDERTSQDYMNDSMNLFKYRFKTSVDGRVWSNLNQCKENGWGPNDWLFLAHLLHEFGMDAFLPENFTIKDPVTFDASWQRYNNYWSFDTQDGLPILRYHGLKLVSDDDVLDGYYHQLAKYKPDLKGVPDDLAAKWQEALAPHLQTVLYEFRLHDFLREVKAFLEKVICLHFYLVYRLLPQQSAQSESFSNRLSDYMFHLVDPHVICVDKAIVLREVSARYPDFVEHIAMRQSMRNKQEYNAGMPSYDPVIPANPVVAGKVFNITLKDRRILTLREDAISPEWLEINPLLGGVAEVARYSYQGEHVDNPDADFIRALTFYCPVFAGTWEEAPAVREDAQKFWGKKSPYAADSLYKVLYQDPYGTTSESVINSVHNKIMQIFFGSDNPQPLYDIFAAETKHSSYFINDWWDFLWVAVHRTENKIVVIYGTATD